MPMLTMYVLPDIVEFESDDISRPAECVSV